jgi:CO/xanthine dehydrogenase Mo-binding subunit
VVKKPTHAPPFVATFVDLDVDTITGKVTLVKVVQVLDCGRIVNPTLAAGQVHGTTVQAIGFALYEKLTYSADGRIREKDLLAYKIPTIFEKPIIEVDFVEADEPTGPYGAKSVGEVAFASVAPAINNAIRDACGFHANSLPISPGDILRGLNPAPESV